jgi:outer membrane protein OmpA-like peptidoglycan-associated protein
LKLWVGIMKKLLQRSCRRRSGKLITCSVFASFLFTATIAPALADMCSEPVAAFNEAVNDAQYQVAQRQIDQMAGDTTCEGFLIPAQRRLAASRLASAQKLMTQNRPLGEYINLLIDSDRPGAVWQSAATLAEVRFGQRQFAEAARSFDRAIEIVKNETLTPSAPSRPEIEGLLSRGAQARLLAANVQHGSDGGGFVATTVRDGRLGGIFSAQVRGVVPRAVPMPITFDYRSASLTPEGEQAAMELARAIKEQQPAHVILVGHTDVRGGPDYNMRLSLERAEVVAGFLRQQSIDVPVKANGVGADEPLHLSDTTGLNQEDIYALNRRVEWRRE